MTTDSDGSSDTRERRKKEWKRGVVLDAENGCMLVEQRNNVHNYYYDHCWEEPVACETESIWDCVDCRSVEWEEFEPC